jgi:TRAP-type C4-dicarboxylate transport system substrate-binding protein
MTPEVLVMSKLACESLSEEDRLVFREAARESKEFMRLRWAELEGQSRQRAIAAGNLIITEFPRRPFEEAMASVYAKAMSDPALAPLIERIRRTE